MNASRSVFPALAWVLFSITWAAPAGAAQITRLSATHHDGQTFIIWTCPQIGPLWTYRVYSAPDPITQGSDLTDATLVAIVNDSTWYDRRLSVVQDAVYGYAIDSLAPPLDATQALHVVTATADRAVYYAVTTQLGVESEDINVTPGGNSLVAPVEERVGVPRPVYQRTLQLGSIRADIYTLWTSERPAPLFPAMANRPGLAFDCAVVRGGAPPNNSLMIAPHHRQGNFLNVIGGSGHPGEWVLALDDPLPNNENTFWYGYHENYDVGSNDNPVPAAGIVYDYTFQRVLYTVLWARRNFPVDTAQVYAMGTSMGGIGSLMLAFHRPDLIAAVYSLVGKFDFSFLNDPNPLSAFNTGGSLRSVVNRFWGTVSTNLPSSDGYAVYNSLNDGYLAHAKEHQGVPPIIAFNGRNDTTVGWAEKIGFYVAMNANRQGGCFFWDTRTHTSPYGAWEAMQDARYLYRFRTDRSYPALSNCTADHDPGDGTAAAGDSVGCINGFVEWDTALVDRPEVWQVTLTLRDLYARWGPLAPPDPTEVDVTPRRLQRFAVTPGADFSFAVTRVTDGAVLQSGTVAADSLGLLTVGGVMVSRQGSRLRIEPIPDSLFVTARQGRGQGVRRVVIVRDD